MTLHWKPILSALLGLAAAPGIAQPEAPTPAPVAGPTQPGATGGSFFEPFDKLDERRWYVSDGWTNGNHQGCTWRRNHIGLGRGADKGVLFLRLDDRADAKRPYGCAELRTRAKLGYGLYEVRMRAAAGSGLNTAMFTYIDKPHDEIDFEFLGKAPNAVQLNYYLGGKGGHESIAPAPGATDGFHTYAFDWAPDAIRWYIDGKLVRTSSGADLPSTPGQLFLSLWNGSAQSNAWLGAMDYKAPAFAAVDWIAFTRAGEPCAFPQSLRCRK